MVKAIFLMLLTGVFWTGVGILFGRAPAERDRLANFFALNGAIMTAFVCLFRAPQPAPVAEVARLAALIVPSALMEVVAFLLLKIAMSRGSQGVAWCMSQSAMAVPFVASVLFLGSAATPWQMLGLALVLAALVLFGRGKGAAGPVGDAGFLRVVFAAFALIGLAQFMRLIPGHAGFSPETLTWRLPLQTPVGVVFWTTVCVSRRILRPALVWRHSLPYGIVCALGQIAFYLATDAADACRATAVVYPVAIGTCILLFTLYCRFLRRELLSRGGWAAVAMTLAGIALLAR